MNKKQQLSEAIKKNLMVIDYIEKVEVAGSGFINFYLYAILGLHKEL
jgi:arginyl-tRNA synthetase